MHQPIIGLTTYGIAHSDAFNIPSQYVQAVLQAGGTPVLLPTANAASVNRWLKNIQGLVLIGGGDIDPLRFADRAHEMVYNVDPIRDACEFELAEKTLDRQLPVLAICRGMQVINILLGGTLHQHLPEVVGEQVLHRVPPRETSRHSVNVAADAHIADAMAATQVSIVSWHHQAVDRLGKGLRPVAWSADGVVEGLELDGNPNLLAVQWHPELSAAEDPTQQSLFNRLVTMAAVR